MDPLEQDLREEFARQVAVVPETSHLAETALRRGKRARTRRAFAVTGAVAAVLVVAVSATSLLPSRDERPSDVASAPLTGPPRVPLFIGQQSAELVEWVGGERRSRPFVGMQPVAQVPAGLLVLTGGEIGRQPLILGRWTEREPTVLLSGLTSHSIAVSDDGERATVAVSAAGRPELREIDLSSGKPLRILPLAPPTFRKGEPVAPVSYSGGAVLMTIGEGSDQRAALWEAGDAGVVGVLDGFTAALGGSPARGAFSVPDKRCRTEVHQLRNGDGSPWKICREHFVGFSLKEKWVLTTNAVGDALIVHDADDGAVTRTFKAPGFLRAIGWETRDTVLYTTVEDSRTLVVRCSVSTGRCATAAEFSGTYRIPEIVRRVG